MHLKLNYLRVFFVSPFHIDCQDGKMDRHGRIIKFGFFASGILCFTITRAVRVAIISWWLRRRQRSRSRAVAAQSEAAVRSCFDEVLDLRKPAVIWNTVIFFPDKTLPTKTAYLPSSTTQLRSYFENAKVKIRMCMYLASLYDIKEVILRKKRQDGVLVQIVTDYDTLTSHNNLNCKAYIRAGNVNVAHSKQFVPEPNLSKTNFARCLFLPGISVMARNTGRLMHNKFAIIDDEAVLAGSLNQTKQVKKTSSIKKGGMDF